MIKGKDAPIIGIVAGELSGDTLGSGLIKSLKKLFPGSRFVGIGGPKMIAEGFESYFPIDKLSIMGLFEVLKHLPDLIFIKKALLKRFIAMKISAFIGIDAPDFNLRIELKLKKMGVKTIHYVSPSVWAWRGWRVKKISKAVDHMLAFMPFEETFYKKHNIPVTCTGHPLADIIPVNVDKKKACDKLGCTSENKIFGLFPGSRMQEIQTMTPLYLEVAKILNECFPGSLFVIPCAGNHLYAEVKKHVDKFSFLNVEITHGKSHDVMAASDALLLSSGTAALEGMFHKKPMVVSYKMLWLTWCIVKMMVKIKWCSLPNILANKTLVPEILQNEATPENLAKELINVMKNKVKLQQLSKEFTRWHHVLRKQANNIAAESIKKVLLGDDS